MIKVTEFPPVTYSSSFVSYIIQTTATTKSTSDNHEDNDNCLDETTTTTSSTNNISTTSESSNNQTSPVSKDLPSPAAAFIQPSPTAAAAAIKMRWQQLAQDAFKYSLNQRIKQQKEQQQKNLEESNNKLDPLTMKHPNSNGDATAAAAANFLKLKQQDLIDLIALNSNCNHLLNKCHPGHHTWVQLSGHENSFALAGPGTIWKKHSPDSTEINVYQCLCNEPISEMIPKFYRNVQYKGDNFIELEDLLYHFKDASIMDIKMGTRTFLESEVMNQKARNDLYEKMVRIDPKQLTDDENNAKAVTKLRYMKFREDLSSSSNLGFRIEGFKVGQQVKHNKNLHMIKEVSDVERILEQFFLMKRSACQVVLNRLKKLRKYFENSPFFQRHEVIGSSLLIIYTADKAGVWMIDFAKTLPVPDDLHIDHRSAWHPGNHEDGYLFGLDNLIAILQNILVKNNNHNHNGNIIHC